MSYKLESWNTYKNREQPMIYTCKDSVKGWIRETIWPTMSKMGWNKTDIAEYGIETPKKWAKRIIDECLIMHLDSDKTHFVYSYTKGINGYMDYVQVFFKKIQN